jgi:poly(A) polymerase
MPPGDSIRRDRRFADLLEHRSLRLVAESSAGGDCHLVGGAVRDAVLGLEFRDLDVVVERRGQAIARRVASALPARLVELGGDRFAAFRLVADDHTLDIWDRQGAPLEADLARRDLTIHSVAVGLRNGEVVDPFQGLADLDQRALRATSETSFSSDPLRVLRLARFAGQLPGFATTERTLELAVAAAPLIDRVASERVRAELERLLELPDFVTAAELLVELTLYPLLWQGEPDSGRSHPTSAELLPGLRRQEHLFEHSHGKAERATARQALLFARSAEGRGRPAVDAVDRGRARGLVTRATAKRLMTILDWERLPRDVASQRWFLHRNGSLWITAACFLAARDGWPPTLPEFRDYLTRMEQLCLEHGTKIFEPQPLITGADLVAGLGLQEGRLVGEILAAIHRRQVEGGLGSRAEALVLAKELARQRSDTAD